MFAFISVLVTTLKHFTQHYLSQMYVHVIGNLDQLDKQSVFFCHPTIKNISAQLALRILIYSSNQVEDTTAETEMQHTVGINVSLSYLETMKE